jgi:hypothetical protein
MLRVNVMVECDGRRCSEVLSLNVGELHLIVESIIQDVLVKAITARDWEVQAPEPQGVGPLYLCPVCKGT